MSSDVQSDANYSGAPPAAIQFHYDAGSAFFRLWLGKTMTYTAARFEDGISNEAAPGALDQAQDRKVPVRQSRIDVAKTYGIDAEVVEEIEEEGLEKEWPPLS